MRRLPLVLLLSFLPAIAFAAHKAKVTPGEGDSQNLFTQPITLTTSDQQAGDPANKCPVTPTLKTTDYPGQAAITSSNNLIKPAGKAVNASGQKVYLYGRVLDKNCVPVSDAIIEIWQANPGGKYIKSSLDDRMDPYPDFVGAGRAVTDNLGRFNFTTIFPGTEKAKHAPHIHFLITHPKFPKIHTEMFFADDNRNPSDDWLRKLKPEQQSLLLGKVEEFEKHEDGITVHWNIVLNGINDFRTY